MKIFLLFCSLLITVCSCQNLDQTHSDNSNDDNKHIDLNGTTEPIEVKIVRLKYRNFDHELFANGKLEALMKTNLKFYGDGYIKNVLTKEGDNVHAGQLLANLENLQQQQSLVQSEIKYKKSVLDYEDQLLRQGYTMADTTKLAARVKEIAKLRTGLSSALIDLQRATADLNNTNLRAPFSGKIANLKGRKYGSSSSSEFFCTLIDDKEFFVNFVVLEQELAFIKASKTIKIVAYTDEKKSYVGSIETVNPLVDQSGMINVRAKIRNLNRHLLDGMSVKVIVQKSVPNQLIIPKSALLERQGRKVVFSKKGSKAYWNYVEVSFENSEEFAVKSGLKEGDTIIFSGNFNLAHDKLISVSKQ